MSPELSPPLSLQETPYVFQRLARLRERLATVHLPPLLDGPCQTWYLRGVALALTQQLRDLYRRRVLQVVQEQGRDALPRPTRQAVTVATTATGALTVQVNQGTTTDPVPAPLARTLAQRYQTSSWHLLAQRLALDLSTAALESLQQTLEPAALTALSETAFVEAGLAAVLQGTPTPFPDRVRPLADEFVPEDRTPHA